MIFSYRSAGILLEKRHPVIEAECFSTVDPDRIGSVKRSSWDAMNLDVVLPVVTDLVMRLAEVLELFPEVFLVDFLTIVCFTAKAETKADNSSKNFPIP